MNTVLLLVGWTIKFIFHGILIPQMPSQLGSQCSPLSPLDWPYPQRGEWVGQTCSWIHTQVDQERRGNYSKIYPRVVIPW